MKKNQQQQQQRNETNQIESARSEPTNNKLIKNR